jgi:prepilin-type N-terminal cleavage/methylation domain-containing protein
MNGRFLSKNGGFTLIEVLVAVVLLAFVSIFTMRSIQNAIRSKEKIQKQVDKESTMRDALRVIERDINDAFNYQDFNAKLFNLSLQARKAAIGQTPVAPVGGGANPQAAAAAAAAANVQQPEHYKPKDEYKYCGFVGDKNSLDFTSLSNIRMAEDEQVSSQAEIGYHLKNCRRRAKQSVSSNCLWRRVAPVIDDDLLKGGSETVLLENVTKFELRYLGPGKEKEWIDQWFSTEKGDAITKGKFPYAVEVTIEVQDKSGDSKDKPLRMTMVAAIRNPNNPPPTQAQDPNNPNAVANPGLAQPNAPQATGFTQ